MRPSFARAPWLVSGLLLLAALLTPRFAAAQFVSLPGNPRNILEGNWQSCQEPGSSGYAERVYDHVVNGVGQYEVHLGPRREFGIFKGVQDEHRPHNSPDNLLKPYQVAMQGTRARQRWEIPVVERRLHGRAWRRLPLGLRELVHPPRADRENLGLNKFTRL